jgi:hypothetical protein
MILSKPELFDRTSLGLRVSRADSVRLESDMPRTELIPSLGGARVVWLTSNSLRLGIMVLMFSTYLIAFYYCTLKKAFL